MKVFFIRHGQTLCNVNKTLYIDNTESITEEGIKQATLAGKYLKQFGKFDLVISSPATRCIQTAKVINKEINYKNEIVLNNLIKEFQRNITPTIQKNIDNKTSKFNKLVNEYLTISNPFDKFDFIEKNGDTILISQGYESTIDFTKKHKKFINQLKKLNKKCILVVGHGGTLIGLTKIITNQQINLANHDILISSPEYRNNCTPAMTNKFDYSNTSITAWYIKDNKINLIIPPNTLHLNV